MWKKVGQPIDKDEWLMSAQTVNAYYTPNSNEVNIFFLGFFITRDFQKSNILYFIYRLLSLLVSYNHHSIMLHIQNI